MIYFVRSPAGRIKIGTTIRLSQRLRQLASEYGEGLEVLAVVDGSFDVERSLHGRFAHLRQVGEWFEPGDDLLGFIVSDGRAWDGADDVPQTGAMMRVSDPFAEAVRKLCSLSGQSAAEYTTDRLLPIVLEDYDKLVAEEYKASKERRK